MKYSQVLLVAECRVVDSPEESWRYSEEEAGWITRIGKYGEARGGFRVRKAATDGAPAAWTPFLKGAFVFESRYASGSVQRRNLVVQLDPSVVAALREEGSQQSLDYAELAGPILERFGGRLLSWSSESHARNRVATLLVLTPLEPVEIEKAESRKDAVDAVAAELGETGSNCLIELYRSVLFVHDSRPIVFAETSIAYWAGPAMPKSAEVALPLSVLEALTIMTARCELRALKNELKELSTSIGEPRDSALVALRAANPIEYYRQNYLPDRVEISHNVRRIRSVHGTLNSELRGLPLWQHLKDQSRDFYFPGTVAKRSTPWLRSFEEVTDPAEAALDELEQRLGDVDDRLRIAADELSAVLNIENIHMNMKLQRKMLTFTAFCTACAVIAVLPAVATAIRWLGDLLLLGRRLFS